MNNFPPLMEQPKPLRAPQPLGTRSLFSVLVGDAGLSSILEEEYETNLVSQMQKTVLSSDEDSVEFVNGANIRRLRQRRWQKRMKHEKRMKVGSNED